MDGRGQAAYLIVMVETQLAMQLESPSQSTTVGVQLGVNHASQAGVRQGHGTHGTRFLHYNAVPACAEIWPASPTSRSSMHDLKTIKWEPEKNNLPVGQVVNGWLGSCRQRLMFMALALDLACRLHGASCARQA